MVLNDMFDTFSYQHQSRHVTGIITYALLSYLVSTIIRIICTFNLLIRRNYVTVLMYVFPTLH